MIMSPDAKRELLEAFTEPNFNETHPELRENEKFLINIKNDEAVKDWEHPSWQTVRAGHTAFTNQGKIVPGFRPLFVIVKED